MLAEDFRPDLLRPALAAALGPAILPAAAAAPAPPMMMRGGTLAASRSLHSLQARVSHTWPRRTQVCVKGSTGCWTVCALLVFELALTRTVVTIYVDGGPEPNLQCLRRAA